VVLRKLIQSILGRFNLRLIQLSYPKHNYANLFNFAKIQTAYMQSAVERAKTFHGRQPVLLCDEFTIHLAPEGCGTPKINCTTEDVEVLRSYELSKYVFIYACEADDAGLSFIDAIVSGGGVFLPVSVYTPSKYIHFNTIGRHLICDEFERQTKLGFAKFDFGPSDFINIIQAIDITKNLAGAFVEVGCFRGSSSCIALRYMKECGLRRNCYFLDVFDGFTYDTALKSPDILWIGTHETEGMEVVKQRIKLFENPEAGLHASVVRCDITEEDLPVSINDIALANIDVDQYEAVLIALEKVAMRIVEGGIIIVEDPGHTPALIGSRLALHYFSRTRLGQTFTSVYMESGQTFLIKNRSVES
jgi:hypothetical protein